MDKQFFFEQNLLALSKTDPALCVGLSAAKTTLNRYTFLESRSGDPIPAWIDPQGAAHPLHSQVDPRREGRRLMTTLKDEGFLIFLGLGGGYPIAAALEREETCQVVVIDYDINGIAELLSFQEYIHIFSDPRFHLLVDSPEAGIEHCILNWYQPVLSGGIRVFPLRTRTELDPVPFGEATKAIQSAIDTVSGDYSVQVYFGRRWFSNIIRNLLRAETQDGPIPPIGHAAISAAGPSLDMQLPLLAEKRDQVFLIAVDTSLPSLLQAGLEPDAVVSIDCQHISYYHFMAGLPVHIPLYLDLASPSVVASRSAHPRFFSGGHPLTRYISRYWRPVPEIDTAGGNVTYAALSLADSLGAEQVELYGADFAYPQGRTYARGTYIYPFFAIQQTRLAPMEALLSAFLFRSPSLTRIDRGDTWYYETRTLNRYRKRLEAKTGAISAAVIPVAGMGAPLAIREPAGPGEALHIIRLFTPGSPTMKAQDFLWEYREKIRTLPPMNTGASRYLQSLHGEEQLILTTLLPLAAAIKHHYPGIHNADLIEAVRAYCLQKIDMVLAAPIAM
ncbi:MAG: DUF115 domain-containing protein [Treponema sp.]|jgi:hypothetical protein|nr:DUF115 domain-containing protein [Treponema sp.]